MTSVPTCPVKIYYRAGYALRNVNGLRDKASPDPVAPRPHGRRRPQGQRIDLRFCLSHAR